MIVLKPTWQNKQLQCRQCHHMKATCTILSSGNMSMPAVFRGRRAAQGASDKI